MINELSKESIDSVFKQATHQGEYVIGLYKLAIPEFDNVEKMEGFPEISVRTSDYIFDKAIEFDKLHHPGVFSGGIWMNNGFSRADIDDWTVRVDPDIILWKE